MEHGNSWEAGSQSADYENPPFLWNWKINYGVHKYPSFFRCLMPDLHQNLPVRSAITVLLAPAPPSELSEIFATANLWDQGFPNCASRPRGSAEKFTNDEF
jgi:hypothetical protein